MVYRLGESNKIIILIATHKKPQCFSTMGFHINKLIVGK